jgi:hypothetical protein
MITRMIALLLFAIILALLFGASAAHAQLILPNGMINAQCVQRPPLPVPPVVVPPQADMPGQASVTVSSAIPTGVELPAQIGGKGTPARLDFNAKGIAIGWWVPAVGSVKLYLYAATWDHLVKNPGLAARLVLLAAAPTPSSATAAAIGVAYPPTLHIQDMCDVWAPIVAPLNSSRPAPLDPTPPAAEWKAAGGAIFKFAGGKITQATARRATKGAACDGITKVTVGLTVFQSLVGGPADEVTGCSK